MGAVLPGDFVRVSHVFICRSHPGGRGRVKGGEAPGSAEEATIARAHGLGWVRYLDDEIRIDWIEGDYSALGHAYRWLGASPDVRDAQGSEWQSHRLWVEPGQLMALCPPDHLIAKARTAHDLVLTNTPEAVAIMTKLILVARHAARHGAGGLARRR